jgi:hypothetical protein
MVEHEDMVDEHLVEKIQQKLIEVLRIWLDS